MNDATVATRGGPRHVPDDQAGIRFRVLGTVDAWAGDHQIDLGPPRQRCQLALLLLEPNQPVHVERLIDLMWGEHAHAGARNTIQVYVSRLRQALAAHPDVRLVTSGPCYQIDLDPSRVDLHVYRDLVADARAAADERAAGLLRRALALWRGRPFDDVAPDHLRATLCVGLDEERVSTAEELVEIELRLGRHAQIVGEIRDLAERYPLRERIAGQYMTALYRGGRRADALVHYQDLRTRLTTELGIDPSPVLGRLHQRILRDDPELAAPAVPPAPAPVDHVPVPRQLPADATHFTGRDTELDHLLSRRVHHGAPPGGVALGAIDGMAGIGKTALAVHAAHRLAEHYPDGQLFIDLHGYTDGVAPVDAATAVASLLRSLGVPGAQVPTDLDGRAALWRSLLADRRMLILLDNAGDETQVAPLLPGSPGCLVLVTSRRRLPGLDGAEPVSLDVLARPEAVALFTAIAGTDADGGVVEEIVELCGRLPLAIRIAAARLRHRPTWTPAHLLTLLRGHQGPLPALEAGQRSVTAALDLSYQHLAPDQRRLYRRLGLHPGPDVEPHAAAALLHATAEDADRLLDDLLNAHLLTEPTPGRYTLHDLVRHHAAVVAATEPGTDRDAAVTLLLDHYAATASAAMATAYPYRMDRRSRPARPDTGGLDWHDPADATAWLDAELPNLLAAALHAADHGRPAHTIHLSTTLHHHLHTRAHPTSAETLHSRALAAARAVGDRAGELDALIDLGRLRCVLGRYELAVHCLQAGLELARATGNRTAELDALTGLGRAHCHQSRRELAVHFLQTGLELARATGNRAAELDALDGLGRVYYGQGRYEQAAGYFGTLLELARAAGNRTGELDALTGFGWVDYARGRPEQAAGYFGGVLELARAAGNRTGELNALTGLGRALCLQGRYEQGAACLGTGLELARATGNRAGQLNALDGLGHLHHARGGYEQAAGCFAELLDLARATDDRNYVFEALFGLGRTRRATGHPEAALAVHRQALDHARELGQAQDEALAHDGLARTHRDLGDRDRARRHWLDALDLLASVGLGQIVDLTTEDIRARLAELDAAP